MIGFYRLSTPGYKKLQLVEIKFNEKTNLNKKSNSHCLQLQTASYRMNYHKWQLTIFEFCFYLFKPFQEYFGEFDGAIKLVNPTGTADIHWVQIKPYAFLEQLKDDAAVHRGRFNSILLQKTTMKKVIPSAQVQHKVHIVHDCFDGHCKFEDGSHTFIEE